MPQKQRSESENLNTQAYILFLAVTALLLAAGSARAAETGFVCPQD